MKVIEPKFIFFFLVGLLLTWLVRFCETSMLQNSVDSMYLFALLSSIGFIYFILTYFIQNVFFLFVLSGVLHAIVINYIMKGKYRTVLASILFFDVFIFLGMLIPVDWIRIVLSLSIGLPYTILGFIISYLPIHFSEYPPHYFSFGVLGYIIVIYLIIRAYGYLSDLWSAKGKKK